MDSIRDGLAIESLVVESSIDLNDDDNLYDTVDLIALTSKLFLQTIEL